jgi:hypothetical protein
MAKKYYLGERINPQLSKPYYKAYGQLSKKEAAKKEKDQTYGSMTLTAFETKVGYETAIRLRKEEGFNVH